MPSRNDNDVTPTGTTVPGAPVTVLTVPLNPVQLEVTVPPPVVGVIRGATRLPPGEKAMMIVLRVVPPFGPVAGSLCRVTWRLPRAAWPVFEVAGRLPEATTEAVMAGYLGLEQVNAVPGTAAVTVNVLVTWAGL